MTKSSTQSKEVWIGGGALAAVAVAALGWFVLVGPEVASSSSINSQTADAESQNTILQSKVLRLRSDSDKVSTLATTLAKSRQALPTDSKLPDYTRQLIAQAAAARVVLTGITAGSPVTAYTGGTASSSSVVGPAAGQLFSIPITVIANGTLVNERKLLKSVQDVGPRRALVSSVQFAPLTSGKVSSVDVSTTMTVQLSVFVAPQTPAALALIQQQLKAAGSR